MLGAALALLSLSAGIRCFAEVCELDLVFAWDKTHQILDEIITGGKAFFRLLTT